MRHLSLLVLILLIKAFLSQPLSAQTLEEKIRLVENSLMPFVPIEGYAGWTIEERMKVHQVQGLSIAVIKDFQVEWAKGYGWADTARQIPMTPDILLSAGSISKWVMSAGVFKLVEEKKLTLDDPVNTFLKSWQLQDNDLSKTRKPTLRMLLSHTAGTSQSAYFGYEPSVSPLPSLVDILDGKSPDGTRRVGIVREPGSGFQYSGGGSLIAQLAMMDVSGEEFEPLMRRLIFDPLGMDEATFSQPLDPKFAEKASWGYQDAVWFKGTPYVYPQQAAAGLYATPRALADFVIEMQLAYQGKGKLLSQASAREMMTAQAIFQEGNNTKEEIAVGPFLLQQPDNTEDRGKYFYFDGANAGFISSAMGNLTEGYGVVVMVNSGNDYNGLHKEVKRAVAEVYDWYNFLPKPIQPVNLSSAVLNEFEGRYRKNDDEVLTVQREENHLIVRYNGGMPIYTFPIGGDSVVFTDYNIRGWFTRDEKGQVTGIQNQYQQEPLPRMVDGEFTLYELFATGRYAQAKDRLRQRDMDESAITYLAYENARKLDIAQAILEVAEEKFPKSGLVWERWGDFYLLKGDPTKALESFKKSIEFAPFNPDLRKKIERISN